MSTIKVFFYIDSLMIGGMHRQILHLAKYLNRENFEPVICTQNSSSGGLREEFKLAGCKLIDLGRNSTPEKKKGFNLFVSFRLLKVLKTEKPNIIFLSAAPNLLYYRIAMLFNPNQIIQIGSFRALTFWKGHLKKIYQPFDNFFARRLYASSECIIVNSIALRNHYSKIVNMREEKPIKVIYNGNDFDFVVSRPADVIRQELNLKLSEFAIIMVARLDPWKDFGTLLETAKIVVGKDKRARFFVIGEGKMRSIIEQKILQMGLKDRFGLIGEKRDIYSYINCCDISVLSTYGEGFSNAILESMAFGKPVIATAVGGNPELIGDGREFGLLIPKKSPSEFANAIMDLIGDEKRRKEMGKAAKERIEELCNLKNYISTYERLFMDIYGDN
jgi:glycosyltransferase involved in cell wall biosynthesis